MGDYQNNQNTTNDYRPNLNNPDAHPANPGNNVSNNPNTFSTNHNYTNINNPNTQNNHNTYSANPTNAYGPNNNPYNQSTTNQNQAYHQNYYQPNYNPQMQYNRSPQAYPPNDLNKPMKLSDWLITLLLLMIPIANIVFLFLWGFGSDVNTNKKHFSQAVLILTGILIALYIVLIFFFLSIFSSFLWY